MEIPYFSSLSGTPRDNIYIFDWTYNSTNAHSYKVVMYIQKLHHFCNTSSPVDGPNLGRSTWEITNFGRFINQFSPNIIRSTRQFKGISKKVFTQKMSIIFNQICINEEMLPRNTCIYIYIYIHTHTQCEYLSLSLSLSIYIYICTHTVSIYQYIYTIFLFFCYFIKHPLLFEQHFS